jgi:hypothetical protein
LVDENGDLESKFSTFNQEFANIISSALKNKQTIAYAIAIRQGLEVNVKHLEGVLARKKVKLDSEIVRLIVFTSGKISSKENLNDDTRFSYTPDPKYLNQSL